MIKSFVYALDSLFTVGAQRRQIVSEDVPEIGPLDGIVLVTEMISEIANSAPWLVGGKLLGQLPELLRGFIDAAEATLGCVNDEVIVDECRLVQGPGVAADGVNVVNDVGEAAVRMARRHSRDPSRSRGASAAIRPCW